MKNMIIKELLKTDYEGYVLDFTYESDVYYDVIVSSLEHQINFSLVKKEFDQPVKKQFTGHLFEPYYEHAKAWGVFDEDILCGVIEINHEEWNKRLRITELLVLEEYRNQGIGIKLMQQVFDYFEQSDYRAICLETQSCNSKAIAFYQKVGFELIGFDTICYSNDDINKKEVRLEFGRIK